MIEVWYAISAFVLSPMWCSTGGTSAPASRRRDRTPLVLARSVADRLGWPVVGSLSTLPGLRRSPAII